MFGEGGRLVDQVAELIQRLRERLKARYGPLASLYEPQPNGRRLLWPPASARAVQTAIRRLGFSLPPLLAAVYRELGNGGSALWLMGVGVRSGQTGFCASPDDDVGYRGKDIVQGYLAKVEGCPLLYDEEEWPVGLVPICDALGCGMVDYCDCTSPEGRIWRWDSPGEPPWISRGLSIEYPSLAAYLGLTQ
jgi:hypothetical protein